MVLAPAPRPQGWLTAGSPSEPGLQNHSQALPSQRELPLFAVASALLSIHLLAFLRHIERRRCQLELRQILLRQPVQIPGNADQLRGVFSGSSAAHMPVMICHRPSVFFQVCVNFRQIPAPLRVPSPYSVTYSAAY